jgi:hypothetical protein
VCLTALVQLHPQQAERASQIDAVQEHQLQPLHWSPLKSDSQRQFGRRVKKKFKKRKSYVTANEVISFNLSFITGRSKSCNLPHSGEGFAGSLKMTRLIPGTSKEAKRQVLTQRQQLYIFLLHQHKLRLE